jgi:hypothetical protein
MGPSQGRAPDDRRGRPQRHQDYTDPLVAQRQQGGDQMLARRQSA